MNHAEIQHQLLNDSIDLIKRFQRLENAIEALDNGDLAAQLIEVQLTSRLLQLKVESTIKVLYCDLN